jgi:hypothetical protein
MCQSDSGRGFGQLDFVITYGSLTTNNYNNHTEFRSPNITVITAHMKSSQSSVAYSPGTGWPSYTPRHYDFFVASHYSQNYSGGIQHCLHSGYTIKSSPRPPYHSSARTTVENTVSNNSSIVARRFVAVETCLFETVTH